MNAVGMMNSAAIACRSRSSALPSLTMHARSRVSDSITERVVGEFEEKLFQITVARLPAAHAAAVLLDQRQQAGDLLGRARQGDAPSVRRRTRTGALQRCDEL